MEDTTTIYKCRDCGWQGNQSQLDFDGYETCMGMSKIEMCPKCGSLDFKVIMQDSKDKASN